MYRAMPDELKHKALSMLEMEDITTVSAALHIRKAALRKLIQEAEAPTSDDAASTADDATPTATSPTSINNGRPNSYTPEFKAAALAMMAEKGAIATIKELGISSYTLYDWKKKASGDMAKYPSNKGPLAGKKRKRYTQEFKEKVIASYREKGTTETLKEYGIVNNTLYNWLNEAGVDRVGYQSTSDHTAAIALYQEQGADAVLSEYGITGATLHKWLKEAGIDTTRPPKYSPELKEKAFEMLENMRLIDVARELGVPPQTIIGWRKRSRR